MWRSRSRFSFKKHINASLFTAHSCSILIHVCLPRCEWQLPISQSSLALPANHMEDLGTCSIFCESTPQRRTVLSLCWATWEQVPAHMSTMNSGREGGGGGPQSRVFNMWGRVGAVVLWLHLVLEKLNDLAFLPVFQTHWVLGSAALPSFLTPVLVEA
jgi:hypothetical protein